MRQSQARQEEGFQWLDWLSPLQYNWVLGTGLQQAQTSGISGSKAFPERQRRAFNPLVSTESCQRGREGTSTLGKGKIPDTLVILTHQSDYGDLSQLQGWLGERGKWVNKRQCSRGGAIHPELFTLHVAQYCWSCHLSWLDPAQLPQHSAAPGGAPLQPPGWSPSLPPVVPIRHLGWHIQHHHTEVPGS